jgi:hypothetical protein
MAQFIVGGDSPLSERDFVIVNAGSDEEARAIYGREIGASEDIFLEHIYDRSINMSFAENFWMQTHEEQETFTNSGKVIANKETFKQRVREYFKGRPDFESLYLEFYFGNEDASEIEPFPAEMMLWMFLTSWGKELVVIPVDEIPLLLYEDQ